MEIKIFKTNVESLSEIIDKRKPLGAFWAQDKETGRYIAVDNTTADAWTEEFEDWEECKKYLLESQP